VEEGGVVHAVLDQDEVRLRRQHADALRGERGAELLARSRGREPPLGDLVATAEARRPGHECRPVHVERLLHRLDVRNEVRRRQRVAQPQAGEPEHLGEGAQQHDRPPRGHVLFAPHARARLDVVDVRLVNDRHAAARERLQESGPVVRVEQRSGGVVRVTHPREPRPGARHRVGDSLEIEPQLRRGHPFDDRARHPRGLRVQPVGGLRDDHAVAW
jgi:hypothetical protein